MKGYRAARTDAPLLYSLPPRTRHAAALFTLVGFVFIAAAYIPGTRIKAAVGHPMVISPKACAAGHLLANGALSDAMLFGVLLI